MQSRTDLFFLKIFFLILFFIISFFSLVIYSNAKVVYSDFSKDPERIDKVIESSTNRCLTDKDLETIIFEIRKFR